MKYAHYPYRPHVQRPYRHSCVEWRCAVFDFLGSLQYTGKGRTWKEARADACAFRDRFRKDQIDRAKTTRKTMIGLSWTEQKAEQRKHEERSFPA